MEAEYLRTNDNTGPRLGRLLSGLKLPALAPELCERMKFIVTTYPEHLREVCDRIVTTHGSVEHYLRGPCQLSEHTVRQLRQRLLE